MQIVIERDPQGHAVVFARWSTVHASHERNIVSNPIAEGVTPAVLDALTTILDWADRQEIALTAEIMADMEIAELRRDQARIEQRIGQVERARR